MLRHLGVSDGFTLTEMLVVIAILGILATAVMVAIDPRQRIAEAKDAKRKDVLAQVRDSLEVYAANHDGKYPPTPIVGGKRQFVCGNCTDSTNNDTFTPATDPQEYIPGLVASGAIKYLPIDEDSGHGPGKCGMPSSLESAGYNYISDGDNYKLLLKCTVTTGLNTGGNFCPSKIFSNPGGTLLPMVDPNRSTDAYSVYSDDPSGKAQCW